jgi:DNA-binding MarR family transcriptional regulator
MDPKCEHDHDQRRRRLLAMARDLFQIEDTSGIELIGLLHRTAHISELLDAQLSDELALSGPRWRLLLRLFGEEQMGNREGVTPTVLSQHQRVSKNTISALLRGLEEQGLIQRNLDSSDLRVFRIQLTDAGRELIKTTAPKRMEGLNQLLAGFSKEETRQLIALLEKLQANLMAAAGEKELFQR